MHLYIHIPFCGSEYHYRAFTGLKKHDHENRYFEALYEDVSSHLQKLNIKRNSIKALFVGGGTPSVVSTKDFKTILILLEPFLSGSIEFSSEVNPNSADIEWLKTMKNLGLSRTSFRAQSFYPRKLELLGRIHDQKMVFKALENVSKLGFKRINLDLIYSTKLNDRKMLEFEFEQLKQIKDLITHLSAHSLAIEPLGAFAKKEHLRKNASCLMKFFIQGLQNLGFLQYEISNFAKNNTQICKRSLAYWKGLDYLGCGLNTVSCYRNERFYTAENSESYLQNLVFRDVEKLNQESLNLEHLFLGLRSIAGIKECRLSEIQKEKANLLIGEKKLGFEKGCYCNLNFLISDKLTLYLSS